MNPKRNSVVTRGAWSVSSMSDGSNGRVTAHISRHYERDGDRPYKIRRAELDGTDIEGFSRKAWDNVLIAHGHLQYFCRNLCGFRMSRAARKRGYSLDSFGLKDEPWTIRRWERLAETKGKQSW